jgi:hypothetical protein
MPDPARIVARSTPLSRFNETLEVLLAIIWRDACLLDALPQS